MKSKKSPGTGHHLQEVQVQEAPHNASQLIGNMLIFMQRACHIFHMVETDGPDQCQATEVLVLETDRLVWWRRYVDIKFMCLVPWLVIKVMVDESSHSVKGLFSHTCCDCCCTDNPACFLFQPTVR